MGKHLDIEVKAARQAHDMNATGQFRSAGGFADDFRFTEAKSLDATHFSVAGSYVAHSTVYVPGESGALVKAEPTNTINFTGRLEREPATGQWMVCDFDWDFAPGSEP